MSGELYASLFDGEPGAELALFSALGRAARLRRAAVAMATDALLEGDWVAEAEQIQSMGAPLQRLAADQGEDARYVSDQPLQALGARGWCVRISLEPTLDGDTLITVDRLWVGEGEAGVAPAIGVALLSQPDGVRARLTLAPALPRAQSCVALSTAGRVFAIAWRE